MRLLLLSSIATLLAAAPGFAQEVRPVPPPGVAVPDADRAELEKGLKELGAAIAELRKKPANATELPNVEVYWKAVDWALRYNEIFDPKQIASAKQIVKTGMERAAALAKGETPWNAQTGLVVRGYRSTIDGSVQPYGLLVPDTFKPGAKLAPYRVDFWCHGRNEKLSELAFIDGSQKNKGEFTPEGAIVVYLYGRFCCANKFAGEMDLFETLGDVKKHYPIDPQRMVVRGFSMGGAACWQFATHHAGLWAAAAPGAGFAETAEFFNVFAPGKEAPPKWEQTLWRWYDCTTMAANLANTSTVAYSGEIDKQKQAADIMIKYAGQEGITIPHIIGPQTPHKYHPDSKPKINELVDAAVAKGAEEFPAKVRLITYTLIYPTQKWVTVTGLEQHWERGEVNAERTADALQFTVKNVTHFQARVPAGFSPKSVTVNGAKVSGAPGAGGTIALSKTAEGWAFGAGKTAGLAKTPTLCGPIDHAFMSSFIFVRPTGKPLNEAVGAWTKAEMAHAISAWRQVFRGDVRVIDDTAVTEKDMAANLVLWGDPSSNAVLGKMLGKLPVQWNAKTVSVAGKKLDAATGAPILIYPNPMRPDRYVVLNSGFTFRETAALNNSDQTPKLPDWALVDISTPPGPKWPGKVVDAGFFNEQWK